MHGAKKHEIRNFEVMSNDFNTYIENLYLTRQSVTKIQQNNSNNTNILRYIELKFQCTTEQYVLTFAANSFYLWSVYCQR